MFTSMTISTGVPDRVAPHVHATQHPLGDRQVGHLEDEAVGDLVEALLQSFRDAHRSDRSISADENHEDDGSLDTALQADVGVVGRGRLDEFRRFGV